MGEVVTNVPVKNEIVLEEQDVIRGHLQAFFERQEGAARLPFLMGITVRLIDFDMERGTVPIGASEVFQCAAAQHLPFGTRNHDGGNFRPPRRTVSVDADTLVLWKAT